MEAEFCRLIPLVKQSFKVDLVCVQAQESMNVNYLKHQFISMSVLPGLKACAFCVSA